MTCSELCVLLCLTLAFRVKASKTACRAPSVKQAEMTNLTCFFPEDISVSKKHFTVLHYNGKIRPDVVVECVWLSGHLQCVTETNYLFDKIVSSTITVQIPRVTENETGKYTCQIEGSKPEDIGSCELSLSAEKTMCEVHSASPSSETVLTCHFPEDIRQSKKDFKVYHFDSAGTSNVLIDCSWFGGALSCFAQAGYQSHTNISNSFTVQIPRMPQRSSENYMCLISGAHPEHGLLCTLRLTESGQSLSRYDSNGLTAAVIVLGCLVTVMTGVILLLCLILKRKKLFCHRHQKAHPETSYHDDQSQQKALSSLEKPLDLMS